MTVHFKHKDELPDATPVAVPKDKKKSTPKPEGAPSKAEAKNLAAKLVAEGAITTREWGSTDTTDPKLVEDFGRLMYLGVPRTVTCDILKISPPTYYTLKKKFIENAIEAMADTGAVGMVALSFDKLEEASRRTLQLIASLDDNAADRNALLNAINTLKSIETEKINLLVKTGVVKVKKKIEISGELSTTSVATADLFSGDKGQKLILSLAEAMSEVEGELVGVDDADATPDAE
jgi:hypothetical protein